MATPKPSLASNKPSPAPAVLPIRETVGIMLVNGDGKVWMGRRQPKWVADHSAHSWQMPHGGIEKLEPPRIAALRELREETGVTSVDVIAELTEWLDYELPEELIGVALKGRYRGQRQKWFAMRFLGEDSEIDISAKEGCKTEFKSWRWVPMERVPFLVIPFRRQLYEEVSSAFSHLLK